MFLPVRIRPSPQMNLMGVETKMINQGWVSMEIWRALCALACGWLFGYSVGRMHGWMCRKRDARDAARHVIEVLNNARMEEE